MKKTIYLLFILSSLFSCNQSKKSNVSNSSPEINTEDDMISVFSFSIPDTVSLGKHVGRLTTYNKSLESDKDYLLSVIVTNQYAESEIKTDTFSDGTLQPFFGINAYKLGTQEYTIIVEEQILEDVMKESDSFLNITKVYHEYGAKITVVKEDYISKLEKSLILEMKTRTNN